MIARSPTLLSSKFSLTRLVRLCEMARPPASLMEFPDRSSSINLENHIQMTLTPFYSIPQLSKNIGKYLLSCNFFRLSIDWAIILLSPQSNLQNWRRSIFFQSSKVISCSWSSSYEMTPESENAISVT